MDNIYQFPICIFEWMSKIINIINSMCDNHVIENKKPLIKSITNATCAECGITSTITLEAIYKQHKRGHTNYICKSCAGKNGWTDKKREMVSKKSQALWANPNYAGTIDGKSIANEIKRKTNFI